MLRILFSLSFIIFVSAASAKSYDAAISTLDLRIQRLENTLSSDGLLDLFQQVEDLENKINSLQGDLETQNYKLKQLESLHAEQIAELNNRITELEQIIQSLQAVTGSDSVIDNEQGITDPNLAADNTITATESSEQTQQATEKIQTEDNEAVKQEYQAAFNLLRESRYDEATPAFKNFISLHPKSSYADNAQYWLAESFYVQRDFDNAILAYQSLIDNYPDSTKVSHAALKLAYSYQELEQIDNAIQTLDSIINNYPGTSIAEEANKRLSTLSNTTSE